MASRTGWSLSELENLDEEEIIAWLETAHQIDQQQASEPAGLPFRR